MGTKIKKLGLDFETDDIPKDIFCKDYSAHPKNTIRGILLNSSPSKENHNFHFWRDMNYIHQKRCINCGFTRYLTRWEKFKEMLKYLIRGDY